MSRTLTSTTPNPNPAEPERHGPAPPGQPPRHAAEQQHPGRDPEHREPQRVRAGPVSAPDASPNIASPAHTVPTAPHSAPVNRTRSNRAATHRRDRQTRRERRPHGVDGNRPQRDDLQHESEPVEPEPHDIAPPPQCPHQQSRVHPRTCSLAPPPARPSPGERTPYRSRSPSRAHKSFQEAQSDCRGRESEAARGAVCVAAAHSSTPTADEHLTAPWQRTTGHGRAGAAGHTPGGACGKRGS